MLSVVEDRRRLHRVPELVDQLPETCAYVRARLERFGLRPFSPIPGSVCAFLDAGKPETAAFRADLDALPVTEDTGLPYASEHPGKMHACGHDGHTAMLLGLAGYAAGHRDELPRNVLFLFQPAEETVGGAKPLCESGVLKTYHVTRVFGLHLWPALEEGVIFSRPGPLMARSCEVTAAVTGRSVHISRAAQGLDALAAVTEYLRRVRERVDALPPEEIRTLGFGRLVSGEVRNAVSGKSVLEGTLRTYQEETHLHCREILEDTGREIAEETGCQVSVHMSEGYPAIWNQEDFYQQLCTALGPDAPRTLDAPSLASEDFAFYQKEVPGTFFFLGLGDVPELHATNFHFNDEAVLPKGLEFLKKLLTLPA